MDTSTTTSTGAGRATNTNLPVVVDEALAVRLEHGDRAAGRAS